MLSTSLRDPQVNTVLERLRGAAAQDPDRFAGVLDAAAARHLPPAERAEGRAEIYMAVAPATGTLCYQLVRAARPTLSVEFGTSYGVSTLYLGAAARDNGVGRVLTVELSETKVKAAQGSMVEAGFGELVDVVCGDARDVFAGIEDPIGFVLLDGWKELYLEILQILEPRLQPGALIIADDASFASLGGYLEYVRDPANGYESVAVPIDDGIEISCRTGSAVAQ